MQTSYTAIGVMSGTSLDGLDIAYCQFEALKSSTAKNMEERLPVEWGFKLLQRSSIDYEPTWRERLKKSVYLSGNDLSLLHIDYGRWLGHQIKQFMKDNSLAPDFIACHGHTVFHQPQDGLTLQIGSGYEICHACNTRVIADFRSKDVALGGQGAPLVPIGDRYLFSAFDFCVNLGGISNMSFEKEGKRLAYDVSVANMLLNYLIAEKGLSYDDDGKCARSGKIDHSLLDDLNGLPYLSLPYPKSTGFEWFEQEIQPIVDRSTLPLEDKLCTAVHHIAQQVAEDINEIGQPGAKVLVTGGGAKNSFLMESLKNYLSKDMELIIPSEEIIEFKEAIVFAFMGLKRLLGEANCLRSVTGASRDNSGGIIFEP